MSRRSALPAHFLSSPFRVGDALADGVTRNRLDARDLVRLHHGGRSAPPRDFAERCAALVPLMSPTQAFTGPTAGVLLGLPLPRAFETDRRLHVSSLRPQRAMRRPEVVGTERGFGGMTRTAGLSVLEPELVWIALGRVLDLADMIAVGDRLVTGTLRSAPLSSVAELQDAVAASPGTPGTRSARRALVRVRIGAWSRPETFVRLLIEEARLPEVALNSAIILDDGRVVIPDLSWPEYRIAVEYDGAWHADRLDADAGRHERLADAGWVVVRIRAHELFHTPGEVVARLVRRLADRRYRHPRIIDLTQMRGFVA